MKLEYYRQGGSEGDDIDRAYIAEWAGRLGLASVWKEILERVSDPTESGPSKTH
jgi:hypothetical protein